MTGDNKKQFDDAFLSAFSSYEDIRIMLDYINIDLNSFSNSRRNLSEVVADVRDYGERNNGLDKIISGALEHVPGNSKLQNLAKELNIKAIKRISAVNKTDIPFVKRLFWSRAKKQKFLLEKMGSFESNEIEYIIKDLSFYIPLNYCAEDREGKGEESI
jgi:hypothetical protein